jgi:hypothetical protein
MSGQYADERAQDHVQFMGDISGITLSDSNARYIRGDIGAGFAWFIKIYTSWRIK